MIKEWWTKINIWRKVKASRGLGDQPAAYTPISASLTDNMVYFNGRLADTADYVHKELTFCGHQCQLMYIDNMVDKMVLSEAVLVPLSQARRPKGVTEGEPFYAWVRDCVLSSADQHEVFSLEEVEWLMMSGFAALLIDGYAKAMVFGLQGFKIRGIDEPNRDRLLRGSREGFVEALRINIMMMRRRMKTSNLKFETYVLGESSKTEVCLAYVKGTVADTTLETVRKRLRELDMDVVLESGMIQPFFEEKLTLFSTVGYTERPDTLCAKLNEGRVGIMVDGTPMALFVPHLFVDNFTSVDDYATSFYYGTFTRVLKYISFYISVFLPGMYVAIGSFHQELLPTQLLFTLAQAEQNTPFALTFEAFLMQVIYESLREAGLRAPRQLGSALNIVGAFLIGQAAVSAGLIGAPMVIIVALTATTSLVVPTLYEPGVIMRFAYILLAGMAGFYGIVIGFSFFMVMMCSIKSYDAPYLSAIAPFDLFAQRDVVFRAPWKVLNNKTYRTQNFKGSNME
ncbi:spore germination protein [Ethanoligenens harbinense]|uniref:GerA spore germination protein n=1 Tax=Ethanoligenens harbinense (strain DSM 18485 / JCM 12961 / CGMCC 1.5033 / YUAN-3) TaxID=663278 RepID=E6U6F8_ETHHY|nr:spore germination protein [Ethanoligenens harbinense]ADU28028.1 GerA spore germination protein [Ethanoligenens harbinense YUAN-3]